MIPVTWHQLCGCSHLSWKFLVLSVQDRVLNEFKYQFDDRLWSMMILKPVTAISTVTGLMIAYDIKEQMTQGNKPNIFKVFAFSCRVVFRLIFFTFGNLTILIFFLNDQRINRWRSILLGDDAVVVGKVDIRIQNILNADFSI